jgi:rsbT co-antagonist protein RsbR
VDSLVPAAEANSTGLPDLQALLDAVENLGFYLYDLEGYALLANKLAQEMWRDTAVTTIGQRFNTLTHPAAIANGSAERFKRALNGELVEPWVISHLARQPGRPERAITVEVLQTPVRDARGAMTHVLRSYRDISQTVEHERRIASQEQALEEAGQQAQLLQQTIMQLATPLIPIYDGVLIMPLVGSVDSQRAAQVLEALLDGLQRHRADQVLLDITGLPIVDTAVAATLLQATQAARLLGADVVLVGVSPEVAQTIVQLGIDFGGIAFMSNLQEGLRHALARRGLMITKRESAGPQAR